MNIDALSILSMHGRLRLRGLRSIRFWSDCQFVPISCPDEGFDWEYWHKDEPPKVIRMQ